jgi:phosphatidylethanolamine/phosphatidyl-N-methylethanolamine N-methyltransferase
MIGREVGKLPTTVPVLGVGNSRRIRQRASNGRRLSDYLVFLRAWLRAPLSIAAQAPSSATLAQAMAEAVNPARPGSIVEFGAGTESFTTALVERGVAEDRLILVEAEPSFAALLRARFPRARVLEMDARIVPARLASEGLTVSAVLSGMPILSWRAPQRLRFVLACLRLAGQGPFVQFTYFPGSPVPIAGRGLRARVTPTIWRNLWPARVWTYRLGDALALSHA